jgi:hypothetical protein
LLHFLVRPQRFFELDGKALRQQIRTKKDRQGNTTRIDRTFSVEPTTAK